MIISPAVDAEATPVFLDFEASGLGSDSWPIEIGLAWLGADGPEGAARLIAPDPSWDPDAWSEESARIHGIPLGLLQAAGTPADTVAAWVIEILPRNAQLLCDAPRFDGRWLTRLFSASGRMRRPKPPRHWEEALAARLPCERAFDRAVRAARKCAETMPAPHRAGPDAIRLAHMWCAALAAR